ncbi:MAG: thioredoxin domain-containing protein [Candidatus Paceibacterota bacterium]
MKKSSPLLLPLSIVIAGLLIGIFAAGAILFTNKTGGSAPGAVSEPMVREISYAPVAKEDHVRGSLSAAVKLIDYSDYECPFCKRHHETLIALMENYDEAEFAWVYRHFPIPQLHQKAIPESVAAECVALQAGSGGFWSFTDIIYEVTPANDGLDLALLPEYAEQAGATDNAAFQSCVETEETLALVESDMEDGENAGARGTPYGLFTTEREINKKIRSAIFAELQAINAAELVIFAEDGSSIGLSGALPLLTLTAIVDILIEYNN